MPVPFIAICNFADLITFKIKTSPEINQIPGSWQHSPGEWTENHEIAGNQPICIAKWLDV